MSQLNSLLESSASNWKNMQSDAARLADKWEKTGLLEGMGSEVNKNNMSMILENQAKQLVVESSQTGGGNASSGTFQSQTAVNIGGQWAGVALPLVRKVFGQIAAKEFVSVQPMNLPSGLVFYLDFQYGDTKNPFTSGESLYGTSNTGDYPFETAASNTDLLGAGGLYGAGKFAYSTNQFSASVTLVAVSSSATQADVNFDTRLSASVEAGEIWKLSVDQTDLSTPDLLKHIAFEMGRPVRLFPFPIFLLKIIAKILRKENDLNRLIGSLRIDSSYAQKILDWKPPTSITDGIKKMVKDL